MIEFDLRDEKVLLGRRSRYIAGRVAPEVSEGVFGGLLAIAAERIKTKMAKSMTPFDHSRVNWLMVAGHVRVTPFLSGDQIIAMINPRDLYNVNHHLLNEKGSLTDRLGLKGPLQPILDHLDGFEDILEVVWREMADDATDFKANVFIKNHEDEPLLPDLRVLPDGKTVIHKDDWSRVMMALADQFMLMTHPFPDESQELEVMMGLAQRIGVRLREGGYMTPEKFFSRVGESCAEEDERRRRAHGGEENLFNPVSCPEGEVI